MFLNILNTMFHESKSPIITNIFMFLGEIKWIYEGINILNNTEDLSLEDLYISIDLSSLLFHITVIFIFPNLPHYVRSRIASHWEIGICQESELDHKSPALHQRFEPTWGSKFGFTEKKFLPLFRKCDFKLVVDFLFRSVFYIKNEVFI